MKVLVPDHMKNGQKAKSEELQRSYQTVRLD